ncbi:MAG: hypothetical protein ACFFCE_13735 [Promethearchaeota archaeon]
MGTENSKYVNYFLNQEFLKKSKEMWEERFGSQAKDIDYTFISHVLPDKAKKDIDREFYVEFKLSHGKLEYNIVYDTTPQKMKLAWIWSGEPKKWKKAFQTGQLKPLKRTVKLSDVKKFGVEAIVRLNSLFFGHTFAIARDFGFLEGESTPAIQESQLIEKKDSVQIKQDISNLSLEIENSGWTPDLGHKLGWNYFNIGDIEKAEAEFNKYITATKKQDVPAFILMKWLVENAENVSLMTNQSDGLDQVIGSFTKEEMMEMYEEGKNNYLKQFQK